LHHQAGFTKILLFVRSDIHDHYSFGGGGPCVAFWRFVFAPIYRVNGCIKSSRSSALSGTTSDPVPYPVLKSVSIPFEQLRVDEKSTRSVEVVCTLKYTKSINHPSTDQVQRYQKNLICCCLALLHVKPQILFVGSLTLRISKSTVIMCE
jgi:hypothetical protein